MTPTSGEDDTSTSPEGVSRRDALKRIAVVGGAAWTLPVIQTVSMQRAYAMGGSPQRLCYSIYLDKRYGCTEAHALDPHVFKCLKGKVEQTPGGCQFVGVSIDPHGDGRWFVTLDQGCTFVAGFSRTAGKCVPSPAPQGATGIIPFNPGGGKNDEIKHIEFTFCRTAPSP